MNYKKKFLSIELILFGVIGIILYNLYTNIIDFKNEIINTLQNSCKLETGVFITFARLKLMESLVFSYFCKNVTNLQSCSKNDLNMLFFSIPDDSEMQTLNMLEENFFCSGLCGVSLAKFMFSDYKRYFFENSINFL